MASSSSTSLFKPTSMANSCLTSHPTLFITKASYPFLSFPSKPIKNLHLSSSNSTSSSSFHLKKKSLSSSIIPFVASGQVEVEEGETEATISEEEEGEVEGEVEEGETEATISEEEEEGEVEGEVEEEVEEIESIGEDSYVEPPEEAKLFVGNLPYDIDCQKLAELFDQAGEVQISEVIYNRDTDTSRGFAFVTMTSVEEAEKAVGMFNGYEINGRALTVNKAAPKGSRPERPARTFDSSLRIYVGNLPWSVDNPQLQEIFSEHGKVLDARVVYDRESGRSRGFGFVTMENQTELDDAIAALDGQSIDGRAIRVNVAEDRPRRQF